MILILHNETKIIKLIDENQNTINDAEKYINAPLVQGFIGIAKNFSTQQLVWCHEFALGNLNISKLATIFNHKLIMASFGNTCINNAIGYVEQGPFLKSNKTAKYPTWLMSSYVGGIYAEVFNKIYNTSIYSANFSEFLSSVAKSTQLQGLWCYSDPDLLVNPNNIVINTTKANPFKFVKKHYKLQWLFILLFSYLVFEKKIPLLNFLRALTSNKAQVNVNLEEYIIKSTNIPLATIDVIIPTIGRAKYIEKVFELLAQQTHLPNKVIVIEQNAIQNAPTELAFIYNQNWPFKIEHQLIYQLGACNARNLALDKVEADYVFFADDDIEFENNFLKNSLQLMQANVIDAATLACLRVGDKQVYNKLFQWGAFGSGCSIVKTNEFKNLKFDMRYEFGFGEDAAFGMQLRNKGVDVFYIPYEVITHLKAPIGGFRTKFEQPWQNNKISPKPSPTVMLFNLTYLTKQQLFGNKLIMFTKFYKNQTIKNPMSYIKIMNKKWNVSIEWAKKI